MRARLASHAAAEAAAERGVAGADAVFPFFNARAYDGRGWCTFESGVATEALARAAFYPELQAVLEMSPGNSSAATSLGPSAAGAPQSQSLDSEADSHFDLLQKGATLYALENSARSRLSPPR